MQHEFDMIDSLICRASMMLRYASEEKAYELLVAAKVSTEFSYLAVKAAAILTQDQKSVLVFAADGDSVALGTTAHVFTMADVMDGLEKAERLFRDE